MLYLAGPLCCNLDAFRICLHMTVFYISLVKNFSFTILGIKEKKNTDVGEI